MWPVFIFFVSHHARNLQRMHAGILEISQLGSIHLELLEDGYERLWIIFIWHEDDVLGLLMAVCELAQLAESQGQVLFVWICLVDN